MNNTIKVLNKKALLRNVNSNFMSCDKCPEDSPCPDMILPCNTSDICPVECDGIPTCGTKDINWKAAWKKATC